METITCNTQCRTAGQCYDWVASLDLGEVMLVYTGSKSYARLMFAATLSDGTPYNSMMRIKGTSTVADQEIEVIRNITSSASSAIYTNVGDKFAVFRFASQS